MSKARIQKLAFTVLLTASIVIMAVLAVFPYSTVYASELSYDDTNVLDDLRSSTVNGTAFDITDYPFVEGKDPQVINFVEYCYSYRANMRNNFGLYLYVYNPSALNIDTTNANNKVQLATSYNADGEPSDYTKFSLKLCSKVESGDYKNLFYKFKIVDRKVNGTTISERVNSNERRYDVSGIELVTRGNNNATEYTVGGTYKFTGFVKGYGPDASAESTLQCTVKYLETVELNVQHTFYRTLTSSKGAGFQNQLDTVYFAVPKRFFENYGKLQRIKAEWYEYKTKDIVVTSNDDFYNKVKDYIGVETGTPGSYGMPPYNREMYYSLGENAGDWGGGFNGAKWGWNLGEGYLHEPTMALYYLFKTTNIQEYDPYADITSIGGVSSNALYDYILNYNKTTNNGTLPIKDGRISADLFEDDIDEYRKCDTEYGKIQKGYSYYDFDADVDLQKLSAWEAGNQSFWDNWINWGLWNAIVGDIPAEQSQNFRPFTR